MEDIKQIYSLFLGIYNYEQFLSKIYDKSPLFKAKELSGALIKLSDYEKIKKSICYNELLEENNYSPIFNKVDFASLINAYDISIEKITRVEEINMSKDELIKMIKGGNKYKIIDNNLKDLICFTIKFNPPNNPYIINSDNLIFLDVPFLRRNNILDEFSYAMCNGYEKIINLAKSIIEYFNYQNEFMNDKPLLKDYDKILDNPTWNKLSRDNNFNCSQDKTKKRNSSYKKPKFNSNTFSNKQINMTPIKKIENKLLEEKNCNENGKRKGYLVNLNWINLWKKYIYYNEIIKENSNQLKEKYEEIAEKLYFYQKNNNKNIELPKIELIYFDSKDEYKNYIKNNNIAIINRKFLEYFDKIDINNYIQYTIKKINYSKSNGVVTIYYKDIQIDFISIKNIILKKAYVDLIILKDINKFQEGVKEENKFNNMAMVEKNWIQELKNKYLYNIYSDEIKQISHENFNFYRLSKEYLDKIRKLEENNELDLKSKQKLRIISKNKNDKQMKYIYDFEMIDIKTINILKILYNDFSDYYYEGEYYISNKSIYSNIIISFKYLDDNYYQIGKIYQNNIFVSNYIIDFQRNVETSYLLNFVIYDKKKEEEFFNKIYYSFENNELLINKFITFYVHKLNYNDDLYCLKNVFLSVKKFEEELEHIEKGKIYSKGNCYLINKNYLNDFKNVFLYDKNNIENIFITINNKHKFNDIFLNKKYQKIFCVQNYLSIDYLSIKNEQISFPINFSFINEEIKNNLNNFSRFLNIKISELLIRRTPLIINDKKIIIKYMLNYILVIKIEKKDEYILDMILSFNNGMERDNYFQRFSKYKFNEILNDQIISFLYNEKDEIIANKYLLNEIRIQNDYNNKDDEIIKNYLKIILEFHKNNEYIDNTKNRLITITPTIKKEEFYIINKKWVDEFKYIFSYDEVKKILNENKQLLFNANAVDIIFNKISIKLKTDLKNLDENIISAKFNNVYLYKLFEKNNNYFLYFDKCAIIKKQMIDLMKINNNNQIEIEKADCIFGDKKIFFDDKIYVNNWKYK